jgi:imidazolonepropionase-like amidohydrolase
MGTDAGTPYNYHGKNSMELVQLVEQNLMTEMEALIASTSLAAEAIGMLECIGTLEPGKCADCLVLNTNPLENIRCLLETDSIHMIFKNGKPIEGKVDTSRWSEDSPLRLA